jgi:GT2 family glycosyltransferase
MIYIIIPVHNRKNVTLRFIQQLNRQTYKNWRVILVDDGCTDGTVEAVSNATDRVIVLRGNGRLWWAGALQMAYKWFLNSPRPQSLVMIANDDAIFPDDFLEKSVNRFKAGTILTPRIFVDDIQIDGGARVKWSKFWLGLDPEPNCCSTRCVLLTYEDFMKVGRWHPLLLPHYLSDTEWTYRANKKGLQIIEGEKVTVFREEDADKSTKLFSKKNPYNPVYYSTFILLACPIKNIPLNLVRIWYKAFRTVVVKILHRIVAVRINGAKGYWWSKGSFVTLVLNTACNLSCPTCPWLVNRDAYPNWKQCTLEQWKEFVEVMPEWVSQFALSGGEPTLVKWFAEFSNWLIDRGHHVNVYTTLYDVQELLKLKRSDRLIIYATYHHQDDKKRFVKNYNTLKGKYRITAWEFEHPMVLPFSEDKPFLNEQEVVDFDSFHCAPDAPLTRVVYVGAEDKFTHSK